MTRERHPQALGEERASRSLSFILKFSARFPSSGIKVVEKKTTQKFFLFWFAA
jgi:hypothetical protein